MSDDLLWADLEIKEQGEHKLIPHPGQSKRIAIYFYRKGNLGDGEAIVGFKWEETEKVFFKSRLWYCGVELAALDRPRKGPINRGLLVTVFHEEKRSQRRVDVSVGYKIE